MNNFNYDFKSIGAEYAEDYTDSCDAWEHAISNDERVIATLHNLSADERAEYDDDFGDGFREAVAGRTPSYKLIDPHNEAGWREIERQADGSMLYANGVRAKYQSAWHDAKWVTLGRPDVMFVSPWDTGDVQLEGWKKEDYPHLMPPTATAAAEKQLAATALRGNDGYSWLTDGADDAYLAALNEEGVKAYVMDYADIIWGGDAHLPRFEELTIGEFFAACDFAEAVAAVTEAVQAAKERTESTISAAPDLNTAFDE